MVASAPTLPGQGYQNGVGLGSNDKYLKHQTLNITLELGESCWSRVAQIFQDKHWL